MADAREAMASALEYHRAGQLEQAEGICRQILSVEPQHPEALNLLGVIGLQLRQPEVAIEFLSGAVAIESGVAKYQNDLAAGYLALRRLDEAVASCRRSLEIDPDYADAHFNLAVILREQGKLEEAVESCRKALAIRPDYVDVHNNLGILFQDQGKLDEAVASYRRALEIRPDYARAHNNLGSALIEQGRFAEAAASCHRALKINPHYAEAYLNQGNALAAGRKFVEAVACYEQGLRIRPNHAAAWNRLGSALRAQGRFDEAVAVHRRALQVAPGSVEAHHSLAILHEERGEIEEAAASYGQLQRISPQEPLWKLRAATLLPNVFQTSDQIDEARRELLADLKRFAERNLRVDLSKVAILGTGPPYDLQFHGRDDRAIKEAYAAIFRNWDPGTAPEPQGDRYRIGFVVTDPHEAIFVKCMRGVLEKMDHARFEPVVICSPAGAATVRSAIADDSVGVLSIPDRLDGALDAIRAARFHLLYYWEVGSGTANYFLPFFRLAPVQCTGWGLPVTSGIPQMDYFLSSQLVEPENAGGHYRERLVLASTLLTYQERMSLSEAPKPREAFGEVRKVREVGEAGEVGLPVDRHWYACLQQIQKFHPEFDPILAEILRRDPEGILIVPRDHHEANTARLQGRFAAAMPDVADRIVFFPQQVYPDYLSLVAAADVLLDPLHFGGGITTYDAFSVNRPIVTLPGEFRRGRFTLACYRKMGIMECVASDANDYVRIAVALAADADYRASVVEKIREASPRLFEDVEAVRECERLFEKLIEESRSR